MTDPAPLLTMHLSKVHRTIVKRLVQSHPRRVSSDDLIVAVYGDGRRKSLTPRATLIVHMVNLRKVLKQHGWTIPPCRQGVTALYRLEPLSHE
jgi:DNA-binding response OmpR family regulator